MIRFLLRSLPQRRAPRRPRGFTLVELMIVIVIVGILAAVSAPSISRSMERNRLADLNRAIANGFNEARSFAMGTGQVVFVDVNLTDDSITFFRPMNFDDPTDPALSCAVATAGAVPASDEETFLLSVDVESFAVDQQFLGQDPVPAGNGFLCISPNGRITDATGRALVSTASSGACQDLNYRFWLGREPITETCPDFGDIDERVERELNNTYFVHVSYSGQVRVMQ